MEKRRDFLKKAALAIGAATFLPEALQAARIKKQGVQLYTVREAMNKNAADTLQKVAQIGYREVELAGYREGKLYGMKASEFAKLLKDNGLKATSGHVSSQVLQNQLQQLLDDCATVGQRYVVCPFLAEKERNSFDSLKKTADLFIKAGEACQKMGMQFGYHNHAFEFDKVEGQTMLDFMLENIPAKLMTIELDLYWTVKAGQNPMAYFEKYPGRFQLWHVKDMDNTEAKAFAEVGQGTIDFKKIFAYAKTAGMKHFFVEQDVCKRDPLESIRMSHDYLKTMQY